MKVLPRSFAVALSVSLTAAAGGVGCGTAGEQGSREPRPREPTGLAEPNFGMGPGPRSVCDPLPREATDADRKKSADDIVTRLSRVSASVRARLSRARRDGDAVASSCQSDKLSRADVTVKSADTARRELLEVLASGPRETLAQKSAQMSYLCNQGAQLDQESDGCVGRPLLVVGVPRVAGLTRREAWC